METETARIRANIAMVEAETETLQEIKAIKDADTARLREETAIMEAEMARLQEEIEIWEVLLREISTGETDVDAGNQEISGSPADSLSGNIEEPVILENDNNGEQNESGHDDEIGHGNRNDDSNERGGLRNVSANQPSRRIQSPGDRCSNADIESNQLPDISLIGQHTVRVFNESTADEQPAMAAWIDLMAAAQMRRDMERAGEQDDMRLD